MVDREKVIEGLQELSDHLFHDYQVCYHGDADDYYKRFLQADAALELLKAQPKQKRGHWIIHGKPPIMTKTCSECGVHIFHHYSGNDLEPFCAWCGAKMNEEEQEGS